MSFKKNQKSHHYLSTLLNIWTKQGNILYNSIFQEINTLLTNWWKKQRRELVICLTFLRSEQFHEYHMYQSNENMLIKYIQILGHMLKNTLKSCLEKYNMSIFSFSKKYGSIVTMYNYETVYKHTFACKTKLQ